MSDTGIKEYPEISDFGYIKYGKVYLKGYFEFKDREIGVVRESDEESMQYFVNRFDMVKQKLDNVKNSVYDAENKGSFLMKLIHMRTYLAQYNGLGDFPQLYDEINKLEDDIRVYIEKNRGKNYEIKTALLQEADSVKGSTDWKYGANKLQELKLKWIKTGSAHKELDDKLTEDFNAALEYFFRRRKDFFKDQARIIRQRTNRYRQIVTEIKRINQQGSDAIHAQKVKALQKEWKSVGQVPRNKFGRIQSEFKREASKYFDNLKYSQSLRSKSSIEIKRDLYHEVEGILKGHDQLNINHVKQIQEKWKKLGKLPNPEDKQLNLKFRITCNELFEMYFLEKSTKYFNPDLYKKPKDEQIRLKMDVLRDSIKKDEDDLADYSKKHAFELAQDSRAPGNYPIFQQRNNFVNKLKTKSRIMKKLETDLLEL